MKNSQDTLATIQLRKQIARRMGLGIALGATIGTITQSHLALGLSLGILIGGGSGLIYRWKVRKRMQE